MKYDYLIVGSGIFGATTLDKSFGKNAAIFMENITN